MHDMVCMGIFSVKGLIDMSGVLVLVVVYTPLFEKVGKKTYSSPDNEPSALFIKIMFAHTADCRKL